MNTPDAVPMKLPKNLLTSRWSAPRFLGGIMAALLLSCCASTGGADALKLPPVTTASGNPRLPGKFVWADLVTDDLPKSVTFYNGLFGWRFSKVGEYALAVHDDRPIAGIFQAVRPADRPAAKPRWFGFISVSSVQRAQSVVLKAGGRVVAEPRKIPDRGEQAVFADPEGALFGVIKSSSGDPEDFVAEVGEWVWIQLVSRDGRKAAEFYRAVAGYEIIENTTGSISDYVLASKGYARATVRTLGSNAENVVPTWLPFVRVKNVRASISRATELGGKALVEPKPELFDGRIGVISDPTGAAIGLLEWSEG